MYLANSYVPTYVGNWGHSQNFGFSLRNASNDEANLKLANILSNLNKTNKTQIDTWNQNAARVFICGISLATLGSVLIDLFSLKKGRKFAGLRQMVKPDLNIVKRKQMSFNDITKEVNRLYFNGNVKKGDKVSLIKWGDMKKTGNYKEFEKYLQSRGVDDNAILFQYGDKTKIFNTANVDKEFVKLFNDKPIIQCTV